MRTYSTLTHRTAPKFGLTCGEQFYLAVRHDGGSIRGSKTTALGEYDTAEGAVAAIEHDRAAQRAHSILRKERNRARMT